MTRLLVAKTVLVWAGILVLAVANGVLREFFLIPELGQMYGLVLSGVLLSLLIVGTAYLAMPWLAVRRPAGLAAIGLSWLGLTLIFEFSFGLFQGKPLAILLEAYTFKGGNIWPLVLLVTACAPYLAARLRGWT